MSLSGVIATTGGVIGLLIFAITIGGFYMVQTNNIANNMNRTLDTFIDQFQTAQEKGNVRGNLTIEYFKALFNQIIDSEHNVVGNLTNHRIISNITRDNQIQLLEQILNQTKH